MQKSRGFTLIEVLVAIAVLTTIMFVPMSIIFDNITQNTLTEKNIKAQLLAQSVIEFVRYKRDTSFVEANSDGEWFEELRTSDDFKHCVVGAEEHEDDTKTKYKKYCIPQCDASECGDENNAFVSGIVNNQGIAEDAHHTCDGKAEKAGNAFTVTLKIVLPSPIDTVDYAHVISCVSWENEKGYLQKVEFKETMYEWIKIGTDAT